MDVVPAHTYKTLTTFLASPVLGEFQQPAKRRFDAVLCWKLDRWGRSVADSIKSIQELASLGVRFLAVTQNLDTDESNPMSRFLLHVMAAFAELEREIIRERVAAGMRAARAKGKPLGRRRLFDRQQVLRLRQEGLSIAQISRRMGIGDGTVVRVLKAAGSPSGARQKAQRRTW